MDKSNIYMIAGFSGCLSRRYGSLPPTISIFRVCDVCHQLGEPFRLSYILGTAESYDLGYKSSPISLTAILSVMTHHITLLYMVISEAFRAPIFRFGGPDTNGYNLGKLVNFKEVFGDDWHYWLIPVYTR